MKIFWNRRRILLAAASAGVATVTGCGTVLHPERRGQPPGRLDWGIVVLDALGLVFFLIPGIIAFAVDFSTGAIYLPPEMPYGYGMAEGPLEEVLASSKKPDQAEVEAIVSKRAGKPIRLAPGTFESEPLGDLKDFWAFHKRWQRDAKAA
jgi:hypothetical protein